MNIKSAKFIVSNQNAKDCPKSDLPEYAFIGRSNVGKSSLINMLTNNKKLAKTSSKPGKTRLINHFLIDSSWHLVDLPFTTKRQDIKNAISLIETNLYLHLY